MSPEEIEAVIDLEIAKTKAVIAAYRESSQPIEPDCAIGRVSRMDAINNQSIVASALRTAEAKLSSLHYMKDRVHDADFDL
jgi:DnaK suppressor protein